MTDEQTGVDPKAELKAMAAVLEAVDGLSADGVRRVLDWVAESQGIAVRSRRDSANDKSRGPRSGEQRPAAPDSGDSSRGCGDVASFVDASGAEDGPSRALAVAYWFQVIGGQESWGSQEVNKELKHQGHGLANVTKTLTSLIQRKPALVVQLKKAGTSRQARKLYKLTTAAIKEVDAMFERAGASD